MTASPQPIRRLRDHPPGLWVLAGTELWDRISFKGMQALLVLYMAGELLLPGRVGQVAGLGTARAAIEALTGPLSPQALAAQIFGLYIAAVTMMPLIGGWIGDRFTGRRAAVTMGALAMTMGHFALAFDRTFLPALALLVVGVGLFRGNMTAQVRALYASGDTRAGDAFQVYMIAVNAGGVIAPLLTGTLARTWGWHAGFALAGFGMLVGLAIYRLGSRHLPPEPVRRTRHDPPAAPLTADERGRLWSLAALWPLMIGFWVAQSQVWNLYNLWARDHLDRMVGGFEVPVPWLASLDSLAPLLIAPLVIAFGGRGTHPLNRMALGCLVFAGACLLLVTGAATGANGRAALGWAVAFHLASNLGWVLFAPVETALYAGNAPERWRGTMLGFASLAVSAASLISGRMGGLYERVSPEAFWAVNAGVVGGTGLLLFALTPLLRKRLASA